MNFPGDVPPLPSLLGGHTEGLGRCFSCPAICVVASQLVIFFNRPALVLPTQGFSTNVFLELDGFKLMWVHVLGNLDRDERPAERFDRLPAAFSGHQLTRATNDQGINKANSANRLGQFRYAIEVSTLAFGSVDPNRGRGVRFEEAAGHMKNHTIEAVMAAIPNMPIIRMAQSSLFISAPSSHRDP